MELLIVIALIAILSVAVLATINPIEQTNKARDAKFKNDVAEVLAGYERYYASQNMYPWNEDVGVVGDANYWAAWADGTVGLIEGQEAGFGVLDSVSATNGRLIETSELKSTFGAKEPFLSTATDVDKIYTYTNGTGGNYVCFCPKANANRVKVASLKCASAAAPGSGVTLLNEGESTCGTDNATVAPNSFCVLSATVANLMCVPEGAIQ